MTKPAAIIISLLLSLSALFSLAACFDEKGGESGTNEQNHTEAESGAESSSSEQTKAEISEEYKEIAPIGEHDFFVYFTNVGKADSIILSVDGLFYMIDTGTSESVPYTLASLNALGVERIEGIFFTHPDRDHIGGYSYIAEEYGIGGLYAPAYCVDMYVFDGITYGKELTKLSPGEIVSLADGVYFEVLAPLGLNENDDNDNSLVLRLRINSRTLLFCGDMKTDEEKTLLESELAHLLPSDILKVAYHGRASSTSKEFTAAVSPEYAVISTSREEESDTADKSVIKRLEQNGAEVFVTEDCSLGLRFDIGKDGAITASDVKPLGEEKKIKLESVSKELQTAVLYNKTLEEVDISGWYIVSDRGGEVFRFPEGSVIGAGEEFVLACRGYDGDADCVWNEDSVWHKTKSDRASLIDSFGRLIDTKKSK